MDGYDNSDAIAHGDAAYRTALDGTDSATITAPLSNEKSHPLNRAISGSTLNVAARFSNASATASLRVTFWIFEAGTWTFIFQEVLSFTGDAEAVDAAGAYYSTGKEVSDMGGATHYNILCTAAGAPSAGTVDVYAWET